MFIGHYAVGFAAKTAAPRVSLGTLFLATQLIDLIWPILLLLGVEHVRIDPGNTAFTPLDFYDYPITHSLLGVVGWSVLLGGVYYMARRYKAGALIVGAGVLSHWVLDFLTHRPDLPLIPGMDVYAGLGLWNHVLLTALVEGALFFGGVLLYVKTTQPVDRTGKYAFLALVMFLFFVWIGNMAGPPPPDVNAIGWVSLTLWLIVPWGYWIDRHRSLRSAAGQQ